MPTRIRLVVTAFVLAVFMALPLTAQASVLPLSVEQMTELADTIVEVRVAGSGSRWTHDPMTRERQTILTDVRLSVTRTLKGDLPTEYILSHSGGSVGSTTLMVSDTPVFKPGQRSILFLDENGVIGGVQGKLDIVDGEVVTLGRPLAQIEALILSGSSGEELRDDPVLMAEEGSTVNVAASAIISAISPSFANAGIGEQITITGSGFGSSQGTGSVTFLRGDSQSGDRVAGSVVFWSDTRVVVVVPRLAESGPVILSTGAGVVSNGYVYKIGFSASGYKWTSSAITYRINANTADTSGESAAIQRAFATWNDCGADFSVLYGGVSSATTYPISAMDGYNDIYFSSSSGFPTGVLAMNYYWYSGTSTMVESDIIFNDGYLWADGAVTGRIDVQTVALHELGHTVGLDDQYGDTDEVMGAGLMGSTRRTLSSYDIAGAKYVHGEVSAVDTVAPGAPSVTSSTHPSQATWYASTDLELAFSASDPSGIAGYSYVLDMASATVPDMTMESVDGAASYSDIEDGEWYFHVRAVDGAGNWGTTTHFRVRVDTSDPLEVIEVQGDSRYETAVETCKLAFPSGASTVVIATGRDWPDALGGAALAGAVNGPILLSESSALPTVVKKEITRLGATHAIILGGTSALSTAVERDLTAAGVTFERLGGRNRYLTASLIAHATIERLDDYDGTAFVSTGRDFPDALAASPMAAAKGWPVFLADPAGSASALVSLLQAEGVTDALVLGGEAVVSRTYFNALDSGLTDATRLYGTNRYATCAAVAGYAVEEAGMSYNGLALSVGTQFPDALAGGALCSQNGSVMLLTDSRSLASPIATLLTENSDDIQCVHFLGGLSAISADVRETVTDILE